MKRCSGIIMVTLLFALYLAGCTNNEKNNSKNTDRRLNGTWVLDERIPIIKERGGSVIKATYKNGNFEYSIIEDGKITVIRKGTYITNDDVLTQTETHYLNRNTNNLVESDGSNISTNKYSIDGEKLTLYGSVRWYGNIFRALNELGLIRDKKTLKLSDSSKESLPVKKSSGKVSVFPGRWRLVEGRSDAKDVELFKDGSGTADGSGITWKVENGRFHILHPFYTFSAYYNVTGSTVTFTDDNGRVTKYQKK